MPKDYYIQPEAPDPVLVEARVLEIVHRYAPQARAVTRVDEHGGEARVYVLDGDLVLKMQRPNRLRPRTSLKKEACFLWQLEGVAGVVVPRVIGHGQADGIEHTLMTRMPGEAVASAALTDERRREALVDLGRMLRRIHDMPQATFAESGLLPGDHTAVDVQWRFGNAFDELADSMKGSGRDWPYSVDPVTLSRRAMRWIPDEVVCVALHSNPGPEHVFVHPGTGKLSGIIDFGDAYFGHPANDLRRFPHPQDRAAILAGYTANAPVTESFMRVWRTACVLTDMGLLARHAREASAAKDELDLILAET